MKNRKLVSAPLAPRDRKKSYKIGYLMQAGVPDICSQPSTGPANHVIRVFEQLQQLGHQARLLAVLDKEIWKTDDLIHFEPVEIRWLDRGLFRLFESLIRRIQFETKIPYAALFESFRFMLACRQELSGYDLLYERMGWMGYGGGIAATWLGTPLILEVNGDHLTEMEMLGVAPGGVQRRLSIALMKRAVHRASHVVATGDGWRRQFIDRWQVPWDKVSVIENGSEIVELLSREQLRSFQPIENRSSTVKIIYVGGFEPWHGVTKLVKAFAKAIAQGVLIQLFLVGSGTQRENIEQLLCNLEVQGHVTMTGWLSPQQYAKYLANADIGISPYCGRVEYSGLKILDYKAAGLAIIASGENGLPSAIEHGKTGWIVPPCDEIALCRAITQFARNCDLRKRMGRQARIEAEQLHSWRNTAQQLDEVFNRVLGSILN
jgi:glycosyltransferase involved in cell wall biosynthesis